MLPDAAQGQCVDTSGCSKSLCSVVPFLANFRQTHELLASILCCWLALLLATTVYFWHPSCCRSPFCCWRYDVPIVSAAVSLPLCYCRLHCFCKHPCFWWRPYCVGGPVVAFIPAVAYVPANVSGHAIADLNRPDHRKNEVLFIISMLVKKISWDCKQRFTLPNINNTKTLSK